MGKCQLSFEFVTFVGMAILMLVIVAFIANSQLEEFRNQKENILLKDALFKVQDELLIASKLEDGYLRTFNIPDKLEKTINYSITLNNSILVIESKNFRHFLIAPQVNGSLNKGNNTINKTRGVIHLNS